MRVRLPFAAAFVVLVLAAGYLGLSSLQVNHLINDKLLHGLTFFALTTCFYWILDTTRRRNLNLTLIVCTGILGVGSEFLQSFLPNGRDFDLLDIAANVAGSAVALALCSLYHKRMLERKRLAKQYQIVPGDSEQDLELGEGVRGQELGIVDSSVAPVVASLEEEVDNWDENAEDDWNDDAGAGADSAEGETIKTPSASSVGEPEPVGKMRAD